MKATCVILETFYIRCLRFFKDSISTHVVRAPWLKRWETWRKFYSCRQTAFLVNLRDTEFHDSITHSSDMKIVTGATSDLFASPVAKGYVTHTTNTECTRWGCWNTDGGGGKHNTVMNTYRYTCNSCLCWYKCTHTHIYIPGRVAYRDTLQGLIGWQHFKSEIQGTVGQTTFSSALDIKTHLRWTWFYLILWYSFIGFYSFSFYLTWMYEWIWMNNELCSTPNVFFFCSHTMAVERGMLLHRFGPDCNIWTAIRLLQCS